MADFRSVAQVTTEFLVRSINHLLEQQPSARREMATHSGAVFRVTPILPWRPLPGAPAHVDFTIAEQGHLVAGGQTEPRVTLQFEVSAATALAFLKDGQAGAMRRVRIEGDAALATAIAGLARQLRWDVEEDLSHLVGDVAAHRLVRTARAGAAEGQDLFNRVRTAGLRWLIDEERVLVGQAELDALRGELRRLRDDVERFGKRIERLQQRVF